MATNGYPKIAARAWRTLRARAATAPSTRFTPATVAAIMSMASPESARDNIVTPMRRLGLIDEDGALTERGNKWRVDASYAEACQEILNDVYPDDLTHLTAGDGTPDTQQVRTWFEHRGFGSSNARQMAATFVAIAGAEVPEAPAAEAPSNSSESPRRARGSRSEAAGAKAKRSQRRTSPDPDPAAPSAEPQVHLDIQIHIPADASADQIDQIFASMAKHLYGRSA